MSGLKPRKFENKMQSAEALCEAARFIHDYRDVLVWAEQDFLLNPRHKKFPADKIAALALDFMGQAWKVEDRNSFKPETIGLAGLSKPAAEETASHYCLLCAQIFMTAAERRAEFAPSQPMNVPELARFSRAMEAVRNINPGYNYAMVAATLYQKIEMSLQQIFELMGPVQKNYRQALLDAMKKSADSGELVLPKNADDWTDNFSNDRRNAIVKAIVTIAAPVLGFTSVSINAIHEKSNGAMGIHKDTWQNRQSGILKFDYDPVILVMTGWKDCISNLGHELIGHCVDIAVMKDAEKNKGGALSDVADILRVNYQFYYHYGELPENVSAAHRRQAQLAYMNQPVERNAFANGNAFQHEFFRHFPQQPSAAELAMAAQAHENSGR